MDAAQLTGATSSYARKYALNGLFAIDDTKDADSNNKHEEEHKPEPKGALADILNTEMASQAKKDDIISVMGTLKDIKERQTSTKKDVTDYYICNMSGDHEIVIAMWGHSIEGMTKGDIIAFKDVKVGSYNGKTTFFAKVIEPVGKTKLEV
jgi:hypothetical protein